MKRRWPPERNTVCRMCGDEYMLRDGCDPTKYCDLCSHKAVKNLERENRKLKNLLAAAEGRRDW